MNQDKRLSVIVRFHDRTRIWQLDQALFSLAQQTYPDLQIILVVQNADAEDMRNIKGIFLKNFSDLSEETETVAAQSARIARFNQIGSHLLASVIVPEGHDGRSALLNEGIALAKGRFLAFLDYDDVVYGHAYDFLVRVALETSKPAALIAGGCRKCYCRPDAWIGFPFLVAQNKKALVAEGSVKSRADLIITNFLPIHSYIIDKRVVAPEHLFFVEGIGALEDYDLLIRLVARYDFNLDNINTPVVEYRVRTDGSNTVMDVFQTRSLDAKHILWARSRFFIEHRRTQLGLSISYPQEESPDVSEESHSAKAISHRLVARSLDYISQLVWVFLIRLNNVLRNYPSIKKVAHSAFFAASFFVKFVKECVDLSLFLIEKARRTIGRFWLSTKSLWSEPSN